MNDATRTRLKAVLDNRVSFDTQICTTYNHDLGEIPTLLMAQIDPVPQAVIVPRSLNDIVETLTFANETGTPVTPRGQASSGFGGAIPTRGGILLDLSEMKAIFLIDAQKMTVDVEPGVVWKNLSHELNKQGLDNCICPTSSPSATVGGWFSMGGVGIGSLRFGSMADVVLEIDVVGLDGHPKTYTGQEMQPFYQTCGTLGIITRLRLKCRKAEALRPVAVLLPDAEAVQHFLKSMTGYFKPDTIMLHSEGYAAMRKAAGGGHSIPKGHFLAIVAIPEHETDDVQIAAVVKKSKGELLPAELAREEWDDRFYPMRIKKVGPTMLVSEFYLPQENFAVAWREISNDLRRDSIGMEAIAVHGGELAILIYLPDCSSDPLYPLRMAKAVRPLRIAQRYSGYPYTAGLWFAAESHEVLGRTKYAAYAQEKKKADPGKLLNPGKIIAPRMRWLPWISLGTIISLGSALTSPLARLLSYRNSNLDIMSNGVTDEH